MHTQMSWVEPRRRFLSYVKQSWCRVEMLSNATLTKRHTGVDFFPFISYFLVSEINLSE